VSASSGAIRAGQAFVELFADDSRLTKGLRSAQARLQSWGAFVNRIGTQVFAAGSAALGAFSGAAVIFSQMGSALDDMSQRTGASIETLSGLKHAAEMSGTSLESVEGSLTVLARKVTAGDKGFQKLGLSVDALRKLSPEDQLAAVADALQKVTDPSQRAALAMGVLGKSATQLLPMLADGAAGLRAMRAEAERLGLVMTTAEAKSAAEFGDTFDTLWSQLKMVSAMIGSAVAPALTTLMKLSQPILANTIAWIRANRPLLANIFAIAAAVAGLGGTLIGLGTGLKATAWAISPLIRGFQLAAGGISLAIRAGAWLVKLLGTAVIPMLRTAITAVVALGKAVVVMLVKGIAAGATAAAGGIAAILTPIGVLGVALAGLAGYILYVSGVFGDLADAGKTTWEGLKQTALTAWGAIGTALANGNLAAAGKVAWNALVLEWTRGTNAFKNVWTNFSAFLQNVFATASSNLAKGLVEVFIGLQRAWIETVDFMKDAWDAMSTSIKTGWRHTTNGIAHALAWVWSQVDDSVSYDRLAEDLDRQLTVGLEADRRERDSSVGDRMRVRDEELGKLDTTREQMLASIEQQRAAKEAEINGARDATLAEREAALAAAQAEFDAAVQAAQESPATAAETKAQVGQLTVAADATQAKANHVAGGTFSAMADRMFASGDESIQEQQLEALKAINENTRKLTRNNLKFA
jgi:hypothetical protein